MTEVLGTLVGMSIAILPASQPLFDRAVANHGGVAGPLGPDTEAVIWLDYADPDGLDATLAATPGVRWVQLPFAGVDAFAHLFAKYPAVTWTSAKGSYAQPVAEHAFALSLAMLRELPTRARASSWGDKFGTMLYGLPVVLVGAGGIGQEFLRLVAPFGPRVTVVRRSPEPVEGAERTVPTSEFVDAVRGAGLVVLANALTDETFHLVDAEALDAMPETSYLVNVGRGPLVDTDALVEALRAGRIAGAALDVTDPEPLPEGHPLWTEPRALITPHTADWPSIVDELLSQRVGANVRAFVSGEPFVGVVDVAAGY